MGSRTCAGRSTVWIIEQHIVIISIVDNHCPTTVVLVGKPCMNKTHGIFVFVGILDADLLCDLSEALLKSC